MAAGEQRPHCALGNVLAFLCFGSCVGATLSRWPGSSPPKRAEASPTGLRLRAPGCLPLPLLPVGVVAVVGVVGESAWSAGVVVVVVVVVLVVGETEVDEEASGLVIFAERVSLRSGCSLNSSSMVIRRMLGFMLATHTVASAASTTSTAWKD